MRSSQRSPIVAGELQVRPADHLVLAADRPLLLSRREYDLLVTLASNPDRVLKREELYDAVWEGRLRKDDRSVDVYVAKLRTKLERALPGWRFIHTHFGFGYRFAAELSQDVHESATAR
jgi:DNA-binding response OmpR family regulator